MTDIKTEIKQFAGKEEQAVRAWFGSNLVPLGIGIVIGLVVSFVIHHL